jgi:hypothetical protein
MHENLPSYTSSSSTRYSLVSSFENKITLVVRSSISIYFTIRMLSLCSLSLSVSSQCLSSCSNISCIHFSILFRLFSSPPDIPEHITSPRMNGNNSIYDQSIVSSSREFHRLPSVTSMTLHSNESTTNLSTNTLLNDEHNASFEDEDDEHCHVIDQIDHSYQVQSNNGIVVKAYALYEFNGKL